MRPKLPRLPIYKAALFIVFALPVAAWAQRQSPPYDGHHMWNGGWHGWFFGPIMMIVFIGAAAVIVLLIARSFRKTEHHGALHTPSRQTPDDILKERFAKGEIDKAEFEERRRVLQE